MVEVVGVRKSYAGTGEVLSGVDMAPRPGAPTVVLGANGSGKSTLLRIVAGCASPTRGRVRGRPPVVGYLPPRFPASSRLSVRRYLAHLGAVHGTSGADAEALLDELGFTGDPNGPVSELSTGNAQKVGLAQALGARAGLLVLDEPWTALDDAAADAVSAALTRHPGAEIVVADHSGRAAELAGAVVHRLDGGRLHPVGATSPAGPPVSVVLRCPGPAREALTRLPPVLAARCHGSTLEAHLDPRAADDWLAAALASRCSVRAVSRA